MVGRILLALVLAGCRLHFEEHSGDAGDASDALDAGLADAGPLALACNAPVQLAVATAGNPRLSATTTTLGVYAAWLDDAGAIHAMGAHLPSPDVAMPTPAGVSAGPWSAVSIATNGARLLAAVGSTDMTTSGSSTLQAYDTTTGELTGASVSQRVRITSPHGLASAGSGFAIAGTAFAAMSEADVTSVDLNGNTIVNEAAITTTPASARVATLGNNRFIAVAWGPAIACTAEIGRTGIGTFGPQVTWGAVGGCTEPLAIPNAAATEMLLIRKDTMDGDLNHQIAGISGSTISLVGDGRLAGVSDDPRGVAVAAGYWVGYRTAAGDLEVLSLDAGGTKGTPRTVAPLPTLDTHDLVAFAGEPYAVWFDSGLWLEHLCP